MKLFNFNNLISCLLISAGLAILSGCSQPILEPEQCIASRDTVKRFYSFHFGNDMKPSKENLEKRAEYLSNDLIKRLIKQTDQKTDYFTQTDDFPKAFRVGGCEAVSPERAVFDILIFWKTEERSEQRELKVEAINENSNWVINKVYEKK